MGCTESSEVEPERVEITLEDVLEQIRAAGAELEAANSELTATSAQWRFYQGKWCARETCCCWRAFWCDGVSRAPLVPSATRIVQCCH